METAYMPKPSSSQRNKVNRTDQEAWINKIWLRHTMEYYATTKRNKSDLHTAMGTDLKNIRSEKRQEKKEWYL